MARLQTTLDTARPTNNRYAYGGGTVGYGSYAKPSNNPYARRYGANVGEQQTSPNQGLFAAMQQGQNQAAPEISSSYSASYQFDPVLQKLSALGQASIANARSDAAALRKQSLIESGYSDVAQGYGADPNTIEASRVNPTSTAALLKRDFADRQRQLDENLNASNLYFSGERVRQMGNQEFGRAQAESDYLTKLRSLLSGIDQELLSREEVERQNITDAMAAAPVYAAPDVYLGGQDPATITDGSTPPPPAAVPLPPYPPGDWNAPAYGAIPAYGVAAGTPFVSYDPPPSAYPLFSNYNDPLLYTLGRGPR
jgi:hypothetical protein